MIPMIPKFNLGRLPSTAGFKEVIAIVNVDCSSVDPDSSIPFPGILVGGYTHYSAGIGGMHRRILHVLRLRGVGKVLPPIVGAIMIDVVNLMFRWRSSHINEGELMKSILAVKYIAFNVSSCVDRPNNIAEPALSPVNDRRKHAGFRVVMNQFFESFLRKCNIDLSHAIASFSRVISGRVLIHPSANYSMGLSCQI